MSPVAVDAAPRGGHATAWLESCHDARREPGTADSPRARGARTSTRQPIAHRAPRALRGRSWCAPRPPAAGAGNGVRKRRARIDERGREEETADSHGHPTRNPLLRTTQTKRAPHCAGVRTTQATPIAICASGGGSRTARSAERREDATRHDVAADPSNTTRLCHVTSTATRRASARTSRLHATRAPRCSGARASTSPIAVNAALRGGRATALT